jgi:hypothetical protein
LKTELKKNDKLEVAQMQPGIDLPLAGMCHQAKVCVCCDIGSSPVQAKSSGSIKLSYCYMKNGDRMQIQLCYCKTVTMFWTRTPTLLIVAKSKS